MEKLRILIEENDTKWGRRIDLFIQSLIIISLISFSIDTLPDLDYKYQKTLNLIETVTVTIFSIEYLLRIIVAKKKLKFIFSFYGIIDLAAILPFYLSTGIDLRSIRAFRLLRLLRALKLVRYSAALKRFQEAILSVKEEFLLFLFFTFIMVYLSGVGIYFFENPAQPEVYTSIFNSLWWSVVSLTTVGFGDMYPITVGGKIFTVVVLIVGLGVVAVPTGLLASALGKIKNENKE